MRIIAMSDSHGCRNDLQDAIMQAQRAGKIDGFVFLGDGTDDFELMRSILQYENPQIRLFVVRGNNDFGALSLPAIETFVMGGVGFFATHGHLYNVKYSMDKLLYAADQRTAKVVLYGHTHMPHCENMYGLQALNPGAICDRRAGRPAYGEILVGEDKSIQARLVSWIG